MDSSTALVILVASDAILLLVGLILHIITIYMLSKLQHWRNQHIIMLNLSTCETVLILVRLATVPAFYHFNDPSDSLLYTIPSTVSLLGICMVYVGSMMIVTLDPLLMVIYKTRYLVCLTRRRLYVLIALSWSLGGTCFALSFIVNYETRARIAFVFIFPVISGMFLIFTASSYAIIFWKIRKIRGRRPQNTTSSSTSARSPRLKLPTLILTVFLLFIALPSIVSSAIKGQHSKISEAIVGVAYSVGLLCDGLIYLLCKSPIKCRILPRQHSHSHERRGHVYYSAFASVSQMILQLFTHYTNTVAHNQNMSQMKIKEAAL